MPLVASPTVQGVPHRHTVEFAQSTHSPCGYPMFKAKKPSAGLLVLVAFLGAGVSYRAQSIPILENPVHLGAGATSEMRLVENLIRDKQFDKAMNAIEVLEKKEPNNPATYNLKGAIYLGKNDIANARKSFERAAALDTKSLAATMNLAQLDLQEKNPEAARKRFQRILASDKTNAQAMMGLAGIAAATKQETEYVGWLQKAAEAEPSAVRPRVLLANYYLQKNDMQKAMTIARQTQSGNPNDIQAMDLLGTVQLAVGENKEAVITYGALVKTDPNNPVAYHKLATAQAAAGDTGAAKVSLNKALALRPDYLDAEVLLALNELYAGRSGEALKIAQQIEKKHPKSAAGPSVQGDILMAQKNFTVAFNCYERAFAINKSGLLATKMHQALSATGTPNFADAQLVQWLQDQPNDVVVRGYLASTYVKARQNRQAIEQYQRLLQIDPNNVRALNDLAWLYQQEKDARALATAEQAYRLQSDNGEIMDTLGWILVEHGKTPRGLELLKKAAAQAPASTAIRYHLAVTLAKSGDKVRARKELEDLLASNKNFPQRQEAQALLGQL
jgi:putative PEP-CTERM system TPR-repeat lipoprotein